MFQVVSSALCPPEKMLDWEEMAQALLNQPSV